MNKLKIINIGFIVLYIGIMLYQLMNYGSTMTTSKILTTLAIIPVTAGPFLIKKILKYEMSETLKIFYYLFVLIALILGSILGWYYKISWFDLFAHLISGIVMMVVALIILKKNHLLRKELMWFHIIFMIAFGLMIASFWEFFEFASDNILGGDTQWVKETGVDDTMEDMLIAFFGSILFCIYYFIEVKVKKDKFMKKLDHVL